MININEVIMIDKIERLQEIIDNSNKIVFFTGAGVSTASGIPDFRSQDGLYNQKYKYPPETIISHSFYRNNPEEFFEFYKDKMLFLDAKPNVTHEFIAKCEEKGISLGVVTQNIDGLHQKAGSKKVFELHGSVLRNYCENCHTFYDVDYIYNAPSIPRCTECNGIIKPDVVLYEEGLDEAILSGALHAIHSADTMIVLGTSLVVYPAAGLLNYFYGDNLVIINKSTTPYDSKVDLCINADFNDVIPKIKI